MRRDFMQRIDVWGGNDAGERAVSAAGIDAWVYSKPFRSSAGGGDVYYLSSCATGRITRLLLADIAGDARSVSDATAGLRVLMRRHANRIDQARLVQSMNRQFANVSGDGAFATALVATHFAPGNHLSLFNAGHPPPLLYRAAAGQWSYLDQRCAAGDAFASVPPGAVDLVNYDAFDVRLAAGDLVLCFTESLIETRGSTGEVLGLGGLLELARSLDVADGSRVVPQLLSAVRQRCGNDVLDDHDHDDDLTIVLFQPNGSGARVRMLDRVLAPVRMMRNLLASLRGGEAMAWPEFSLANVGGAFVGPLNRFWSRHRAAHVLAAPAHAALPDPMTRRAAPPRVRRAPAVASVAASAAHGALQADVVAESAAAAPVGVNSAA